MGGGHWGPTFTYPKWVWAPGGWWPQPKAWRLNTAVVMLGIGLVCYPIYKYGEAHETILITMKDIDDKARQQAQENKK